MKYLTKNLYREILYKYMYMKKHEFAHAMKLK